MNFVQALQLLLIALRLCGVILRPWWQVIMPSIATLGVAFAAGIVLAASGGGKK